MNTAKSLTVLLVEDNRVLRTLLRSILTAEGYLVVGEASNADTALQQIENLKPAVVTLDLIMPGRSGMDILPEIRNKYPELFVVIVSGSSEEATIRQAVELGAIAFVTKPFNSGSILRVFEQISAVNKKRGLRIADTPQPDQQKKQCILVDDNRSIRALLRAILEKAGIQIVGEADNGMEGLLLIEEKKPDLVFLDVDMPCLDGINTLTCLRAIHPALKVVLATSRTDRETIAKAMDQKVSGYILKPFTTENVTAALRKLKFLV